MTKFLRTLAILLFFALFHSGCASIVSPQDYSLHIRSEPKGAKVTITDRREKVIYTGITPASLSVRPGAGYFKKAEYYVTLSAPGYADKTVPVRFKLNAWYFGNIVFGGVIGLLIVDPLTGAMWKISDPVVDETLAKSVTLQKGVPQLNIVDINSVPQHLLSKLERLH